MLTCSHIPHTKSFSVPHTEYDIAYESSQEVDPVKISNTLKNVIVGVQMTEKTLLKTFRQHGVERYNPLGQIFDPNLHQALFEAPMPDKVDRTVIQVIKSGFTYNGRVIRPADVGVVRDGKPAPAAAEGAAAEGAAAGGEEKKAE